MIDYKKDGVDHINIYSKGKTSLGRFLSNFAQADIETEDGNFASIEGYWYWLICPSTIDPNCKECDGNGVTVLGSGQQTYFGSCNVCSRDYLKELFGKEAKTYGRELQHNRNFTPPDTDKNLDFQRKIKSAIKFKIDNNPNYKIEFSKSVLPFEHYYVFYGKVKEVTSHRWVIDYLEELRKEYGKMSTLQTR